MDGPHWEVTADFNRLNVLLMRVEEREKKLVARKVATATMSDAKFQGRLGEWFKVFYSEGLGIE